VDLIESAGVLSRAIYIKKKKKNKAINDSRGWLSSEQQ
jgi:hypothetical protein